MGVASRALIVLLLSLVPGSGAAAALPRLAPGSSGFHLLARSLGALNVNQVSCGLQSTGTICADSTGGPAAGGFWPRGTGNDYIFSSGLQVAGIIGGSRTENPWAGDTVAAFFFNSTGAGNGEQVRPIFNSTNPEDLQNWPAAAQVPDEPNEADNLFHPSLRGRRAASEGDVWWLTWDGNPTLHEGRPHPLGVLLEQRGMAWNTPSGNQDILYFIYTLYNITSTRVADYVGVRPAMREILLEKARDFQELNAGVGAVPLPPNGYPIIDLHVAFGTDMDVGAANEDYSSVNIPFALGYTFQHDFPRLDDWTFDPQIFGPPFFPGTGLAGVKYLHSPSDRFGQPLGLTVFSSFGQLFNNGAQDPKQSVQLYRYLRGQPDAALGDPPCNADPKTTHICFINKSPPADMRFLQATGPITLAPGASQSIVVAYIFAAPVKTPGCPGPCDLTPGDPTVLGDAARMANGVNQIDSVAGYRGFKDLNGDGRIDQSEFASPVPGSLLGKALVAQTLFDNGFLNPSTAPESPDFFLVPGRNQVAVVWRPSASEAAGDPSFDLVGQPTAPDGTPNRAYDPNFRRFDVEGYRIYRGRVDTPSRLQLIAQFDYANTALVDWRGQVNPTSGCAPEFGINTAEGGDIGSGCRVPFDSVIPGVTPTVSDTFPLVGSIVQVKLGGEGGEGRVRLADGTVLPVALDTAVTGVASGCVAAAGADGAECTLRDTGVPFQFVDRDVRNDVRYFYAVTAFDVNSIQTGPSSLESSRRTKNVTPANPATNLDRHETVRVTLLGRDQPLDTAGAIPALDPATGRFGGPFPPANAFAAGLTDLIQTVVPDAQSGSVALTLDSLKLGSAFEHGAGAPGLPTTFYLTSAGAGTSARFEIPVVQNQNAAVDSGFNYVDAFPVDEAMSRRFQGGQGFQLQSRLDLALPGINYTASWGAGCGRGSAGFVTSGATGCEYNGPRWFDGPSPARNETRVDPQSSHPANSPTPAAMADLNNAGELTGVTTIQVPHAYETAEADYRNIEGVVGGAQRAADFNVWWGAEGLIDSVTDATHNVPVPFDSLHLGGTWGVLNPAATNAPGAFDGRPDVLTSMDFTCVEPLRSLGAVQGSYPCTAPPFLLSRTAASGPIAIWDRTTAAARTASVRPGAGFALYLPGTISIFELAAGLPPAGTVWTLRTYVGAISGGHGLAGDRGPYHFTPQPRPLTAVGVQLRLDYEVVNRLRSSTPNDLSRVHTVPDPYYVTNGFESTSDAKVIQFVNLPTDCLIRIYSSSGVLVTLLQHHSAAFGGSERWNVLNRNNQVVGSGVYFYHIEAGDARRVGRFVVVNFAE